MPKKRQPTNRSHRTPKFSCEAAGWTRGLRLERRAVVSCNDLLGAGAMTRGLGQSRPPSDCARSFASALA